MIKFFLTLLVCSLPSVPALAETYKIALQRGKVEITRNGVALQAGQDVMSGDKVSVPKGGILILKSQRETLKIFQDTVLTPYEEKDGSTVIGLAKGALVSMVQKKEFKIKTKNSVMGVRGTQFFVQLTSDTDAWMCVQEGVVNVATEGVDKAVDVPAGKGVFIGAKEISTPKAYAWTKGINWKMDPKEGKLEHKIKLNYDLLNNFYD